MNPWIILGNLTGWVLIILVLVSLLAVVVAFGYAVVQSVLQSRRKDDDEHRII